MAYKVPASAAGLSSANCLWKLAVCVAYICASASLIRLNKLLMQNDHFPFALPLSAIHMLVSFVLCLALYLAMPSMFPAMEATKGERLGLLRWFVPVGVCFAIMLYGSNEAYLYCSVTLLQFMKEANIMIVFTLSAIVGLQCFTRVRTFLIVWVLAGAIISVSGDIKFSLVGIAFQLLSQLAQCSRMVMGEILLTGRKLDALTYTLFVAPLSVLVLLAATISSWDPQISVAAASCWPLLIASALVAFLLNVLGAMVIKETSAVGLVLTGLIKDIVLVVVSCVAFGEPITGLQLAAFFMTLCGVGCWGLLKADPTSLPIWTLEKVLCVVREEAPDERWPIFVRKV